MGTRLQVANMVWHSHMPRLHPHREEKGSGYNIRHLGDETRSGIETVVSQARLSGHEGLIPSWYEVPHIYTRMVSRTTTL